MALPASGGTYAALLQPGINPLAVRKAIITDVLIRDYLKDDGSPFNLSDPAVGLNSDGLFSPFAADGKLRSDLLINAPGANLGFYHVGGLHEDGTEIGYNTDVADTMIAQSKRAVRFDVTQDNDTVTIKALEGNPIVDALRYDLPLSNLPDIGKAEYTIAKAAETALIERMVIVIGFDGDNFFAQTFPRMALRNRGNTQWNKADADVMELELGALLCPFVGKAALFHREGAAWRGLQGAPVFAAAPVATAVAGQKATIEFAKPTSKASALTYAVEKSANGTSGWATATVDTVAGTSNITVTVDGVSTGQTAYFRVTATGTNKISTVSAVSNSVTGIA